MNPTHPPESTTPAEVTPVTTTLPALNCPPTIKLPLTSAAKYNPDVAELSAGIATNPPCATVGQVVSKAPAAVNRAM